jgi:DNA-binding response OmpR family regulator
MKNNQIFIIEDDANLLYNLESNFSVDQFLVESSQGDEDLEVLINKVREFSPDYIILDLILPKLDGFEVLKKLKEDDDLLDVPIFIFTDLSDEDSKARSIEMGAEHYFIKEEMDAYQFAEKVKKIILNQEKIGVDDFQE